MQYQIIPPPQSLSRFVRYFWTANLSPIAIRSYQLSTMVDDSSGMIFQRVEKSGITKDGVVIPRCFLYGQTTNPTKSDCLSEVSCVGVLFYPHATHELFGFNASELTDLMLDWSDLGTAKTLADQVINAETVQEGLNLLVRHLQRAVRASKHRNLASRNMISYIRNHKGLVRVQDIKEYFKVSERTLERHFLRQIGVSPRHFIQVVRFQEIIHRFRSGFRDRMVDITYDLSFSDQSHFNTLVRKFADCTPRELRDSIRHDLVNVFLRERKEREELEGARLVASR